MNEERKKKILKELASPEIMAILNAPRPVNRAQARLNGSSSRADALEKEGQRYARFAAFREGACNRWFADTLQTILNPFAYRMLCRSPWWMLFLGVRIHVKNEVVEHEGRMYPSSLCEVTGIGVYAANRFIWEV